MLSTTAEYALRIMIHLAEANGEQCTSEEISQATMVPGDYAVKVLQWLGKEGLVLGHRGRRGGFRLDCNPKKTTLLDVVTVIDPLERIHECPLGREAHKSALCPLHQRIDDVIGMLIDTLGSMTLTSVIEGSPGPTLCAPDSVALTVSKKRSKSKKRKGQTKKTTRQKKTTSRKKTKKKTARAR